MSKKPKLPPLRIDIHNHLIDEDDGSNLIDIMDRASVETTLIMGVPNVDRVVDNEGVLKATKKYPGRLVGGACADPRDGAAAMETIRRYHGEGFRVVKLVPNRGYYPDDETFLPFFETVAKLKMAVLSHCGWLTPTAGRDTAAYYSHPGRFEKVIRRFPETPFIMAHMGGIAGWLETVMLTTRTPNTYADCSPGQGTLVLQRGGAMVGAIPPGKLMFGADSTEVQHLLDLTADALAKQGFGAHFQEIFYGNARALLEKIGAIAARPAAPPAAAPRASEIKTRAAKARAAAKRRPDRPSRSGRKRRR